ncbi:DNA-directed DNA polymerase, family A, palm domain containing protein [uncultured Caudovirales phage]|uniref:DNA-directed DNA polymerase, family A, palm domain containing protein n=1 Tax=uncultured Caudovirales phage TaxID=2100421 RepID=A0A6J5LX22_9CAUD|nr:DNA-directed DNA polymerase, family A, palm domain containing protein [uncultured Caudovirales phage]
MKYRVIDCESDGLLDDATKIHVLSWTDDGEVVNHTHDYDKIKEVLTEAGVRLVGHNVIRYDMPLFNKILGLSLDYTRFIDTLGLSWYIHFDRQKHGLEGYGVDYGVPKPKVDDWKNLTPEQYAHRCNEDVKINWLLWKDLERKLNKLYDNKPDKIINYLGFKLDCAREAEHIGIDLDVESAQKHHDTLQVLIGEKTKELILAMPKKPIYKEVNRPKNLYKKDGSPSSHGERWFSFLKEMKLPPDTVGPVNQLMGYQDGNPASSEQVKDWLYSLGWQPRTYKFVRDKDTGEERQIEQVRKDSELCDSVTDLIEDNPSVALLEGLTVMSHRASIFKAFLEGHKDGRLKASIAGLTNTLRFKHAKPLVNLPGVEKVWGKEIRGCLIAPEGYVLCGSDMVSLEDNTKRHYMQPLDPKYVEEMSQPGFDPHLNLALFAGAVTQEDIDKHTTGEINLKPLRKKYKAANYSAIYGVGKAKLARDIGVSPKEAQDLLDAYWKRNWAIKRISEQQEVKVLGNSMWLKNPVSGFWHQLRSDKDRFSTLNQSTGVYCFDTWLYFSRQLGQPVLAQFHDEQITMTKVGKEELCKQNLKTAITKANDKLNLNIKLDVDVQFGNSYASVH